MEARIDLPIHPRMALMDLCRSPWMDSQIDRQTKEERQDNKKRKRHSDGHSYGHPECIPWDGP